MTGFDSIYILYLALAIVLLAGILLALPTLIHGPKKTKKG